MTELFIYSIQFGQICCLFLYWMNQNKVLCGLRSILNFRFSSLSPNPFYLFVFLTFNISIARASIPYLQVIFGTVVPSVILYDSVCGGDKGGADDTGTISSSHNCSSSTGEVVIQGQSFLPLLVCLFNRSFLYIIHFSLPLLIKSP